MEIQAAYGEEVIIGKSGENKYNYNTLAIVANSNRANSHDAKLLLDHLKNTKSRESYTMFSCAEVNAAAKCLAKGATLTEITFKIAFDKNGKHPECLNCGSWMDGRSITLGFPQQQEQLKPLTIGSFIPSTISNNNNVNSSQSSLTTSLPVNQWNTGMTLADHLKNAEKQKSVKPPNPLVNNEANFPSLN